MNRKQLAILLSREYLDFQKPILKLEQYGTTVDIATHIVFRAMSNGDIEGKNIVDVCSGPGILGICALLLGARTCTFVEVDPKAVELLEENLSRFGLISSSSVYLKDALEFTGKFDTCLMNPPFGIQQGIGDKLFLKKAIELATTVYSIHDGSEANRSFLPKYVERIGAVPVDYYITRLSIKRSFTFHKMKTYSHDVMVLRSIREIKDRCKEKV